MKTLKTSYRLLPMLIGSLLALESGRLQANDDELLMFVEVSKAEAKPFTNSTTQASTTVHADAMKEMLAERTRTTRPQSVKVKPAAPQAPAAVLKAPIVAVKPATPVVADKPKLLTGAEIKTLPATPLLQRPAPTVSETPAAPLLPGAPEYGQRAEPVTRLTSAPVATVNADLPVFRPAGSAQPGLMTPSIVSPQLTPNPALSVTPAPAALASASPGERELRGLFARAVMTALERSPQMRSTRLQVDAAKEDVSNAKGQRWPQVDVTSNSRRYEFGNGSRNASDSNMPAFGVNVATNLIDFGQTSNTIKSKEFSVKAADQQNIAQREDLAWQVSSGLIELSKQRLVIEMSKQYVSRMQELVKMLSGIVQADQGRRSELTQATGRYLQAQSALDNAVSKARDTEIVLYRLIGETQVAMPPSPQWQLQPSRLDALLAQIEKHPTLQQARAQSQAAFAEADALKASSLPKVNWVVSKDTGKDYYGREQSWQTGINVSWGLFRGGSAKAAEQAAVQRAAAMREQGDNQRDDLEQRVRAADQDARSMLQRADLYRSLSRESDRIRLDFFDQWYHLGKRTLLDVLSAESDFYNNRVAEVTNRFDGYSAIFRGYASAGQLYSWLNNSPAVQ
ncbi:adhesin transport system outer membrane protein [Kluyvera sp. 1366]